MASVAEEIAALRGTRRATLRDLLTHRSFSKLWQGMLASSIGDWVCFVAVTAMVARLGGQRLSGPAVAGVMLARLLPSVMFGPIAGVLADRFDRKKLMTASLVARGLMYAAIPLFPVLWAIYLLSFLIECLTQLWTPAKDAIVPNLVPRQQLANANSVSLLTTYGTLPLGAMIFTALTGVAAAIGEAVGYFESRQEFLAMWLGAAGFLFSARMVSRLDPRRTGVRSTRVAAQAHLSIAEELRDGVRFLREHPLIRSMTMGIVIAFAGVGSVMSLGPVFARYSVNAGSTGFGILMIAIGVGMGIGMASLNWLSRFQEKDRILYEAMFGSGVCLLLTASMPTIALAALFTVPMGIGVGLAWVSGYTMLQENVTDEFRGRTFATLTVSARAALFIALAGFPALAAALGRTVVGRELDASGARPALWLGALVAVLAGIISRRGLKRSRLVRPRPLALLPRLRKPQATGKLIAFEGVEGSGKGTQIKLAQAFLRSRGREVLVTREPGGTQFGDRLRETILDPATGTVDARAEALLFAASRAHLVSTVIRPALSEGKVVLCDRFVDSSVAYQGVARGLGEQDILTLNAWATQGLFPDLVILLHLEPEQGLARSASALDRIESEDLAFHAKVSDAYLRIAEDHPERFAVIDATGGEEDVHKRVCEALDRVIGTDGERAGAT
jgi:dTMP kinase